MSNVEDKEVKIPALIHLLRLGYKYKKVKEVNKEINYDTNILENTFRNSIKRINNITDDEIKDNLLEISKIIKKDDLGKEFNERLTNSKDKIKLIDYENIENNNYTIITETPFYEKKEGGKSFRPDITVLINGMPLSFLEAKKIKK